jgi:peptide subunit release factor 1 (eRF1)
VLFGDAVAVPMLREEMSQFLQERVIDAANLPTGSNEPLVLEKTLEAVEKHQAETDRERVEEVIGAWRAGGLGVVGVEEVRKALEVGQVDELLLVPPGPELDAAVADELLTRARHTSATVYVINDASLLTRVGSVAALLRYRVPGIQPSKRKQQAMGAAR